MNNFVQLQRGFQGSKRTASEEYDDDEEKGTMSGMRIRTTLLDRPSVDVHRTYEVRESALHPKMLAFVNHANVSQRS